MSDFFTINRFTSEDVIYFIHKIFCLTRNSLLFQYKNTLERNTPKYNLRTFRKAHALQ